MNAIKDTAKKFTKGLFKPDNKLSLIPNWLSFSRVIGGIAIPFITYTNAPLSLLFGSITFLAVSDFLDGLAARKIAKEETAEGAMLDAVSDKIFSILLILGILPILPIFAINGVLEGVISIINVKLLSSGGKPKSNILGKVKIWPLSIALILGYLALAIQNLNLAGITNETLLTISTLLSAGTIPLQAINIKQYYDKYQTNKEKIEIKEEKEEKIENQILNEKTKEKQKTPKLLLDKSSHQAIFYEIPKEEKIDEKGYSYTKKSKH